MERQKARVQVPQSRARGYPVYRIPAPKMEINQLGTTLYAASGGAPTRIWSLRIPTRRQTSNSTAAVHSSCTSSAPGICWQDGRSGQHAAGEESVGTQTTNDPGGGGAWPFKEDILALSARGSLPYGGSLSKYSKMRAPGGLRASPLSLGEPS